ncbi:MAG: MFS transporter, partial [Clostridia bacterium]|nr:MFS transporter [Clostridia bacterium]
SKERSDVISFTKIINSIGSALPEVLFLAIPLILNAIYAKSGNAPNPLDFEKKKYFLIALFAVVIGGIMYVNCYFHIKERVALPNKKKVPGQPGSLSRIFHCKPLMLVVIMGILSSGRYLVQAAAIHVARYSFYIGPENPTQADILNSISLVKTIFQVCTIVGMFGTTLIMPMLMKKFDYKKIVITTCLAGFAASVVTTLIGYVTELSSIYILAPFIVIQSIPLGVINVISYAMICDSLDYMELTTGVRENGLGSACQGFINKIGNAFSTCGIIVLYMLIDMDPAAMLSKEAIMAATDVVFGQRFAMFTLVSLLPGISMMLCAIPMFFYKIAGKNKEKMLADLAEKRAKEGFVVAE